MHVTVKDCFAGRHVSLNNYTMPQARDLTRRIPRKQTVVQVIMEKTRDPIGLFVPSQNVTAFILVFLRNILNE